MIRHQHPEMFKDEQGSPEQLAAKAKGLEQQVGMLTQQVQQMGQIIETKKVEVQAKGEIEMAKAQLEQQTKAADIASRERMAQEANATNILITRMKTGSTEAIKGAELLEERFATGLKVQAENIRSAAQIGHEVNQQHETLAHDVGMARAGGTTMNRHVERGTETGQEQESEKSQGASGESSQETARETIPQADGAGE
jgi:hypothetical protein